MIPNHRSPSRHAETNSAGENCRTECMKIEYRSFACPMLMQRTHLKITSSVPETDESLNPAPEPSVELDCASKMRCGIARMDAQGNISFKWDQCPASTKWTGESRR